MFVHAKPAGGVGDASGLGEGVWLGLGEAGWLGLGDGSALGDGVEAGVGEGFELVADPHAVRSPIMHSADSNLRMRPC